MELFATVEQMEHEQVVFFHSKETGLKAIIAIHNTVLGPALGGLRMWPYENEQDALTDVLRLSQGMTYKSAIAGLNLGGGKAVLIGDPKKDKSEAFFRALGRFIESLSGRYITAEDVNTNVQDMDYIFQETDYVVGVHPVHGGSGDPSPFTAFGVLQGIRASVQKKYGHTELGKLSFAVQGAGHVGGHLIKHLRDEGAKVFVCDLNEERVQEMVDLGAEAVAMDDIYDCDAKVFSPCALGASVNEKTLPRLKCEIVAGAANNQLQTTDCGTELHKRGVLYAPDYAINAGGVMNVAIELQGYDQERAGRMVNGIYDIMMNIYSLAEQENIPSWQAADRLAEKRIHALGKVKLPFVKQDFTRLYNRSRG
ncbi:MAG TPA: Glu/Leu/Phe/Val dehydrogenase dimerization domain-containing protein [Gammaproteobacteria bacterium]|nr:Glu/Leu/Phe/Val dehydrogenase dimerization domain-containing protein [Gammaproteobacteria bacterium]